MLIKVQNRSLSRCFRSSLGGARQPAGEVRLIPRAWAGG